MTHEELVGAVARGWCSPENSHKQLDPDLAMAIVAEVRAALAAQPVAPQPPIDNAFVASGCEQFSSHKSDATRLLEILGVALDECRRLYAAPPAPAAVPLTDARVVKLARKHGNVYTNRHYPESPAASFSHGNLQAFARALIAGDKP